MGSKCSCYSDNNEQDKVVTMNLSSNSNLSKKRITKNDESGGGDIDEY